MSKWKKWTVVLEMNDGSLFAMRQKINTRNPGEVDIFNAEAVDKDNVKRRAVDKETQAHRRQLPRVGTYSPYSGVELALLICGGKSAS